jgi:hypothetical protein
VYIRGTLELIMKRERVRAAPACHRRAGRLGQFFLSS